jgi:hypothetical protein
MADNSPTIVRREGTLIPNALFPFKMLPEPPSVELEPDVGVRDSPSAVVVAALVSEAMLRTVVCARAGWEVIDVIVVCATTVVGVMKTEVVTVTGAEAREDVVFCGARTPVPGTPITGVVADGSSGGRWTGVSCTPLAPQFLINANRPKL